MAFFFHEGVLRHGIFISRRNVKERETYLAEILSNLTNPVTTSKLLKCFQFCVLYASDVQPTLNVDVMSEAETISQSVSSDSQTNDSFELIIL